MTDPKGTIIESVCEKATSPVKTFKSFNGRINFKCFQ